MKPVCKSCGGKNILYRRITDTLYCRRCGYEWKRKKKEENYGREKNRNISK